MTNNNSAITLRSESEHLLSNADSLFPIFFVLFYGGQMALFMSQNTAKKHFIKHGYEGFGLFNASMMTVGFLYSLVVSLGLEPGNWLDNVRNSNYLVCLAQGGLLAANSIGFAQTIANVGPGLTSIMMASNTPLLVGTGYIFGWETYTSRQLLGAVIVSAALAFTSFMKYYNGAGDDVKNGMLGLMWGSVLVGSIFGLPHAVRWASNLPGDFVKLHPITALGIGGSVVAFPATVATWYLCNSFELAGEYSLRLAADIWADPMSGNLVAAASISFGMATNLLVWFTTMDRYGPALSEIMKVFAQSLTVVTMMFLDYVPINWVDISAVAVIVVGSVTYAR